MAERHRLRGLQMRKSRHHRSGMLERAFHQRTLQRGKIGVEGVNGIAHIKAEIGRDLIVARTCGMQPTRRRADQFAKPAFHIHVNVFERALEGERACFDF
ncbi:hypothetical protein BN961_00237 [Afipia felis]|uniref:Uncharacterized protein n=1 Tax=Afipia felis TaxID=1035 RepID=A0A090MH23_AFIFE|nr:hypothetical protein BN961_00237 [Afipia felis]